MTEKRFTIVNMGLDGRLIKEDGEIITLERVVDLLNENEQLKKIIEDNVDFKIIFSDRDLNEICNEMGYELSENEIKLRRLEKENEGLKQQLKEKDDFIDEVWRKYEDAHGLSIDNTDWF